VAVDASSYFSRPGPRIIDGLELLAHIIHPELVPEAPGRAFTVQLEPVRSYTGRGGPIGD
jgi:iron complex transport system substrate-binding protein